MPHLVEQTRVVELPDELATADDPHVLAVGGLGHLGVHPAYVVAVEPDARGRLREGAVRHHPRRQRSPRVVVVVEDPLPGRGPHDARTDAFARTVGHDALSVDVEPDALAVALVNRYHAVKRAGLL